MPDQVDTTRVLQTELAGLTFPLSATKRDAVRERVCEYVDAMHALGWPPERVIVALKRVANDARLSPSSGIFLPDRPVDARDQFMIDMVGWCIERYFHRPE